MRNGPIQFDHLHHYKLDNQSHIYQPRCLSSQELMKCNHLPSLSHYQDKCLYKSRESKMPLICHTESTCHLIRATTKNTVWIWHTYYTAHIGSSLDWNLSLEEMDYRRHSNLVGTLCTHLQEAWIWAGTVRNRPAHSKHLSCIDGSSDICMCGTVHFTKRADLCIQRKPPTSW